MKYKLKLLPIVYQDLRKAKKWYLGINTALGENFKLKVNEELELYSTLSEALPEKTQGIKTSNSCTISLYYLLFN